MKKRILISVFFLALVFSTPAQDAKEILKSSFHKCQSIKNGYYEMTKFMKFVSKKDTAVSSITCYFQKLKDDSLYSLAFHYKRYWEGEYLGEVLYTGEDFVTTNPKDSTGTIMSKALWAKDIKSVRHNYTFNFYSPLTDRKSSPLPQDSDYFDNIHFFKFIGEEILNNTSCYHIQVNETPENDGPEMVKYLRNEWHFWISKTDLVPIQYSTAYDMVMNNDTMYQYEKDYLNNYELNNLNIQSIPTLNSLTTGYKLQDYVPYKSPIPLKKDSVAPNWKLFSLFDKEISLTDFKGRVVLIDFFYRSCYPCMQALPALQALHEKYHDKGLTIIGIDPYDKKEDNLSSFLAKRGVTYPVLLGGKDAAKDYRVSGYPTMYLIDKSGRIIFHQVGYGKGIEYLLEKVILDNL